MIAIIALVSATLGNGAIEALPDVDFLIFLTDHLNKFAYEVSEFHHGKAVFGPHGHCWPHRSKVTSDYLKEVSFRPVPHPPFSPDLGPAGFYLFRSINGKMTGSEFGNAQEVVSEMIDIASFISHVTLACAFRERQQGCGVC
jgi:hypothetical protein